MSQRCTQCNAVVAAGKERRCAACRGETLPVHTSGYVQVVEWQPAAEAPVKVQTAKSKTQRTKE